MSHARARAIWIASVFPMLALFGCGDASEEAEKDSEKVGKTLPDAVTVLSGSTPSILKDARAVRLFSLPEGFFEWEAFQEATAEEVLVAVGLEFPKGTYAEFDREEMKLEVKHSPVDLMLAEAAVESWRAFEREQERWRNFAVEKKLREIVLPEVNFENTPFLEALALLEEASVENDLSGGDPLGVKIIMHEIFSKPDEEGDGPFRWRNPWAGIEREPVQLRLVNVPLSEALRYTTSLAQIRFEVRNGDVVVRPLGPPDDFWETRAYTIPADFPKLAEQWEVEVFSESDGPSDPFSDAVVKESIGESQPEVPERTLKEFMMSAGISFHFEAQLLSDPERSLLVMKNTRDELSLLEAYLRTLAGQYAEGSSATARAEILRSKAESIRLPRVVFSEKNATVALREIQESGQIQDRFSKIWDRGVLLRLEAENAFELSFLYDELPLLTMDLSESSLDEVVREVARQIDATVEVDAGGYALRLTR